MYAGLTVTYKFWNKFNQFKICKCKGYFFSTKGLDKTFFGKNIDIKFIYINTNYAGLKIPVG